MQTIWQVARNYFEDERGASAIEYGLLSALIALALIVSLGLLGDGYVSVWQTVLTVMDNALAK